MYQALYRKWRPRNFDDVVGQEHVTDTLKNQVKNDRLSHAYLFVGTRGTGKTSCAKILAKAVNCEHPENGNPCNKCRCCIGIDDGSILDVVELDAASNNGVDNVRALRDEAIYSPAVAKKRVYIIDEVHMLSTSAFNALLKILEEPPQHLLFILATTELHKVPATILSRCQRHSFKRINPDSLTARISYVAENENMRLEPNAAALLARLADGSLRDGLSLLDQCSGYDSITAENVLSAMGLAGNLRISELLTLIVEGDSAKSLELFRCLWSDGKAPATLLTELTILLRDILMIKVAPKGGRELLSGGYDLDTINNFAKRMVPEELICDINSIQEHIGALRDGRDPKTSAELCIIKLCEPDLSDSIDTLKKRIARLETSISNGTIQIVDHSDGENKKTISEKVINIPNLDTPPFDVEDNIEKELEISQMDKNAVSTAIYVSDKDNSAEPNSDESTEFEKTLESSETIVEKEKSYEGESIASVNSIVNDESSGVWENVLGELKKTMLAGQYNIISNDRMAIGVFDGETVTVNVSNDFVKGQLEQPNVMNSIREAVHTVLGRVVLIKISVDMETKSANTEKLNNLSKFGNVKFE